MRSEPRTPNASKVKLTNHQKWLASRIQEGAELFTKNGKTYAYVDGDIFWVKPRTVEILKSRGIVKK